MLSAPPVDKDILAPLASLTGQVPPPSHLLHVGWEPGGMVGCPTGYQSYSN